MILCITRVHKDLVVVDEVLIAPPLWIDLDGLAIASLRLSNNVAT
jgi:hypothetical protein